MTKIYKIKSDVEYGDYFLTAYPDWRKQLEFAFRLKDSDMDYPPLVFLTRTHAKMIAEIIQKTHLAPVIIVEEILR